MLFTEFRFVFFFAAVFGLYWAVPWNPVRKAWLLVASYVFYAAWDWRFLSLIWISTVVDYVVGLALKRTEREAARRVLLVTSIATNLGMLFFFKYWNFFAGGLERLLDSLGFAANPTSLDVLLPVGISFFTFQTMSYSIDVFRRKLAPTRNFLDLALFVAFFPQLVAGPIVRASRFLVQLPTRRRWSEVPVRAMLVLFLVGYVQKAVVADNAAPVVDAYFAAPGAFTAISSWIGTVAYAIQIYGDFAGYSAMAIACAGLLGYWIPVNFNFPYMARNVTDFWRRWHISLSTWLRDYLYIPLGGGRGSRIFTYRNLMITMLLGGLWHGAAWRFVIWGGLHGVALVAHREWARRFPPIAKPLATVAATAVTFWWVCLAWIFFRAPDASTAWTVTKAYVLLQGEGSATLTAFDGRLGVAGIVGLMVLLGVIHFWNFRKALEVWVRVPRPVFAAAYGLAIPVIVALVPTVSEPFVYFQF